MRFHDEAIIYAICEGEINGTRACVEEKYERGFYITNKGFTVQGLEGKEALAWIQDRVENWQEELNRYGKPYAVGVLAQTIIAIMKAESEVIGDNWVLRRQVDTMTVYYIPFSNVLIFYLNKNEYIIVGDELYWDIDTCSFDIYTAMAKVLAADKKQHLGEVIYAYCCKNLEGVNSQTCYEITSMLDKVLDTGEKEKIIQGACRFLSRA